MAESRADCEDGILVRWWRCLRDGVLRDWNVLKSIYVLILFTNTGKSFSTSMISMDFTCVVYRASDAVDMFQAVALSLRFTARCSLPDSG